MADYSAVLGTLRCGPLSRSIALLLATACAWVALSGCGRRSEAAKLAPLRAASWMEALEVPGFAPARVAVPLGATAPRPLAIVLHGGSDRPEWQCGTFRGLLGNRAFVLCPAGRATSGSTWGLGNVLETEQELRAALAAMKRRYGAHLAKGSVLLVGYAEGAEHAALIARQEPKFFSRLALLSGGAEEFGPTAVKVFVDHGGKRVLFFNGDADAHVTAKARAVLLRRGGVEARAETAATGPWLDDAYVRALSPNLAWLLQGFSPDGPWSEPKKTAG